PPCHLLPWLAQIPSAEGELVRLVSRAWGQGACFWPAVTMSVATRCVRKGGGCCHREPCQGHHESQECLGPLAEETGRSPSEKVSSLGKEWHKFCLKCERCSKTLTPGGHAEHDGKPFCHKPCYATLFGPKGVNIGGAGSYIYEKPLAEGPQVTGPIEVPAARAEERKASAEKVTSLGKDWHRPCLRCERCGKTLTPGGHAEHDGQPYCHKPCYGILFGPKGVNTGAVGSYIYDRDPEGKVQP
uniref:Cysteine-rich protein 2 n=1 Tax=Colobus angolensis palliatus TaxID=336983 RepID=A0A2K5JS15_COLAP